MSEAAPQLRLGNQQYTTSKQDVDTFLRQLDSHQSELISLDELQKIITRINYKQEQTTQNLHAQLQDNIAQMRAFNNKAETFKKRMRDSKKTADYNVKQMEKPLASLVNGLNTLNRQ